MTARAAFAQQAHICAKMGSPFTARVLRHLARRIAAGGGVFDRIAGWPGDLGPTGASVPLRLAGGLHHLVLSGADPALSAVYPPHDPADATLDAALDGALETHAAFLDRWLDRPPQTNELRRSAVAIAAAHWLQARLGLPMEWLEVGASAGLNLCFDDYLLVAAGRRLGPAAPVVTIAPDWRGTPPVAAAPRIAARAGCDVAPMDPGREADRRRLLSYIWPDQDDRLTGTRAALAHAATHGATVTRADAGEWLETRLGEAVRGRLRVIFHSVAWQYFPPATAARARAAIGNAARRATPEAPLARLSMEADGTARGAALRLDLWPGAVSIPLGRADFHARWIDWRAPAP